MSEIVPPIHKQLINDVEAAARLGVAPPTLRSWRCRGIGPAFIKLGRGPNAAVRYDVSDLDRFIEEGRRSTTSMRAA